MGIASFLLGVLLTFSSLKIEGAESVGVSDAIFAAYTWLSLLDNGNYSKSWEEASHYLRENITQEDWEITLSRYRKPLGKSISRKVKVTGDSDTPSGKIVKHVIIKFETLFENKKIVFETIAVVQEKNGEWRTAGYFIKKFRNNLI